MENDSKLNYTQEEVVLNTRHVLTSMTELSEGQKEISQTVKDVFLQSKTCSSVDPER